MIALLSILLLATATLTSTSPTIIRRAVQQLNQAATDEAHKRDGTATRAFSDTAIKVCIDADGLHYILTNTPGDF